MAFAGCAAKEFSIVPRARTEVGLVSTSRLAALAAGPAPAGFLPRLARKGHAFSERANRHGFFGDGSMWAVSERERSGASKQRKLRARADQQLVSFKRESRRARALERELADRERWMTELLAMKNAAVLVQVRYRIFAARRKVDLRRQLFNSKFLVRLMKYRMHKKRVLRATQRIKIACKFFNAKRDAALRLLREEAATDIQAAQRGRRARVFVVLVKVRRKTTAQVVHSVILFGFARAQQCLMGPHTAAGRIQKTYRRHLRWRRQADKRAKRLKHGKASAVEVMKKLTKVVDDSSKREVAQQFELPSPDMMQDYIKRGASMRMNADGIYQLVRAAKFMATEKEKQEKEDLKKRSEALQVHKADLNASIIEEDEEEDDDDRAAQPQKLSPRGRRASKAKLDLDGAPKRAKRKSAANIPGDAPKARSKRSSKTGISPGGLERKISRRGSRSDVASPRRGSDAAAAAAAPKAPPQPRSRRASRGDRPSGERSRKGSVSRRSSHEDEDAARASPRRGSAAGATPKPPAKPKAPGGRRGSGNGARRLSAGKPPEDPHAAPAAPELPARPPPAFLGRGKSFT